MDGALKTVHFVYIDGPRLYEVSVDQILRKREGDMIIVDDEVFATGNMVYIVLSFKKYNASTDEVINVWREHIGKDYPKVYPLLEIV